MASTYLVTGGAGFIGSAVARHLIERQRCPVIVVDKLTYSGNLSSLAPVCESPLYQFRQIDICDREALRRVFEAFQPDVVLNLAAESHVDRSIDSPGIFLQTNVMGTFTLLETARRYWQGLSSGRQSRFRFHHVSTDEVYGDLDADASPADEKVAYAPSSPYSASKAASDHLVNAWHRTYGLPVTLSNCSNNYGPYQFPEKLIPHVVLSAIAGKALPIYGDGLQIRDWLYVEDHVEALCLVASKGLPGSTYNIGGDGERTNLDVVRAICGILDDIGAELRPAGLSSYAELIAFVRDRPGHDRRYAISYRKMSEELGWRPAERFETGLRKTVEWYLANPQWWRPILENRYRLKRMGGAG